MYMACVYTYVVDASRCGDIYVCVVLYTHLILTVALCTSPPASCRIHVGAKAQIASGRDDGMLPGFVLAGW